MLVWFAAGSVFALAIALWCSPLVQRYEIRKGHFIGATLLVAWTAGVGAKFLDTRVTSPESELVSEAKRVAAESWGNGGSDGSRMPPVATAQATAGAGSDTALNAPPVAALISGLEARLAQQPDDAKGWALLAQSYAFIGNAEGAERALTRAVELGMEEQPLRERVRLSAREAHGDDWIEQAIGG